MTLAPQIPNRTLCHAAVPQAEARSLQMPLRFLAHLRLLLGQAGAPPAGAPPEPAQPSAPSALPEADGPPASLTWASLDGARSSLPVPAEAEQRIAGSAGASTSAAQAEPGAVRRRRRRHPEAPAEEEAAPSSPGDAEEALAATPLASANSSSGTDSSSSSSLIRSGAGTGAGGGGEEAQRLAAAVADIRSRRCPPLGRFGHGNANLLKVTARERSLPYAIKVTRGSNAHCQGTAGPCRTWSPETLHCMEDKFPSASVLHSCLQAHLPLPAACDALSLLSCCRLGCCSACSLCRNFLLKDCGLWIQGRQPTTVLSSSSF